MRKSLLLGFGSLVAVTALAAELVITSFSPNGEVTWTNAVSNATYRVEWASSAAGPWREFEALTNLSSIPATNTSVTVKVPMFYRVVWTDAPPYAGIYDYRGYDVGGSLVMTGRVSLAGQPKAWEISGSREFYPVGDTNIYQWPGPEGPIPWHAVFGPHIFTAPVTGQGGNPNSPLGPWMNLSAGYLKIFDDYFYLSGWLVGNTYAGHWDREGATRPLAVGTFTAVKQNAAGRLPPPDPSGVCEYEARTAGGGSTGFLVITGALSFATSPNSTAGNWLFDKVVTDPPRPTAHPVGQRSFTNAVISTNTLSISSMHRMAP